MIPIESFGYEVLIEYFKEISFFKEKDDFILNKAQTRAKISIFYHLKYCYVAFSRFGAIWPDCSFWSVETLCSCYNFKQFKKLTLHLNEEIHNEKN